MQTLRIDVTLETFADTARLAAMVGKRLPYDLMDSLGLDTTLQWQVVRVEPSETKCVVTVRSVPVDLDDADSVAIDATAEMKKKGILWLSRPTVDKVRASGTPSGYVDVISGRLACDSDDTTEFVEGLDPLAFWTQTRGVVCDWGDEPQVG